MRQVATDVGLPAGLQVYHVAQGAVSSSTRNTYVFCNVLLQSVAMLFTLPFS